VPTLEISVKSNKLSSFSDLFISLLLFLGALGVFFRVFLLRLGVFDRLLARFVRVFDGDFDFTVDG
jgi:hypothetical protein